MAAKIPTVIKSVSCGDCIGFHRRALIGEENAKPCSASGSGVMAESKPCAKFRADIFSLSDDQIVAYRQLTSLTKMFDERALRVVAAAFATEYKTRALGFRAGQRVYVRYRSYANRDYISNFMLCYVLDVREDFIHLGSKDGKLRLTFPMPVDGELCGPTLYDAKSFKPLLRKMRNEGKFFDDKAEVSRRLMPEEDVQYIKRREKDCGINPISIERAVRGKPRGKRRGDDIIGLVELAARIENGRLFSRTNEDGGEVAVLDENRYLRSKSRKRKTSGEMEIGSINYKNV